MVEVLIQSGKRSARTGLENNLRVFSERERQKNVALMHKLCDDIVADRKANPNPDVNDLLNVMLSAADPKTGEKLDDENIRHQMETFLVAGHETTSGTLSFAFYNLIMNPECLMKAQKEVDEILGDGPFEERHCSQLKYIEACIRETLRFRGPISAINVTPKEPTRIAGKYEVFPGDQIACNFKGLHHDPKIWGPDTDVFRPERLLNGGWEALPANAWKPFGNGARGCIGRAFAEQEMIMNIALILQRFNVKFADPSYDLRLKSALTIKPDGLKLKVSRRAGKHFMVGIPAAPTTLATKTGPPAQSGTITNNQQAKDNQQLLVLYGSNAGTCKGFAEDIQTNSKKYGFEAFVQTLDEATGHLPVDKPVIIVTTSYEGKPTDNARQFVAWLESNANNAKALEGVKYSIFGAGNSEWYSTFHRIPKLVDEHMSNMGATRIAPMGLVDVKGDISGPWEDYLEVLWSTLTKGKYVPLATPDKVELTIEDADYVETLAGSPAILGTVVANRKITNASQRAEKRHMEIQLPAGMTYSPGDYLAILPINPSEIVSRVVNYFGLYSDQKLNIKGTDKAFLKSEYPITVNDLLATRVELSTPASQRQIAALIEATPASNDKQLLQEILADFESRVVKQRSSILDLLEDAPSCTVSLASYLDMLKPLTPRQYSISSSPLASQQSIDEDAPVIASITYDVHSAPSWSGHGIFQGVASTYLARHAIGSKIRCFVRSTNSSGFRLPVDPSTPLIMIAAGTGIAPMRGFVQHRANLAAAGAGRLGKALLYFGCRDVDGDYIYKDEFAEWQNRGVVDVRPAFSERGTKNGHKYAHERMWEERKDVVDLFQQGAKILVCGSASKLGKSASYTVVNMYKEAHPEKTDEEAWGWLDGIKETRYVSDVFG